MFDHQSVEVSSYRPKTVITCLAFVSCLFGLLFPANVLAQESVRVPEGSGTGCVTGVQEKFLRVESKSVLHKVLQNGKVLDPGFFSIIPDSAVSGSKKAMGHLSHARLAHGAAFAAVLSTAGLLVGAEVIRQQHDGSWTRPSTALAFGSVLTLLSGFVFAQWRDWETFETVNSYNYDLVNGQLDH
jgi:hypothetical protein